MASTWTTFPLVKLWFILSSLLLCYVLCSLDSGLLSDCNNLKPDSRHESFATRNDKNREHLFVSTLDGKVSALDLTEGGRILWSQSTGASGLFSSSMSKLKVTSNGQVFRLVPSLDGNLYRFNGQSLERLPMNADALLRSSFGLADDTVITGGKESQIYGINLSTGEMRFTSAMQETVQMSADVDNREDILVVQRVSHTVRAVEPRSGEERWNFSVGEHFLSFKRHLTEDCSQSQNKEDSVQDETSQNEIYQRLQVVPKDGFIGASAGKTFSWSHKFDSPIVHAWHLKNGKLELINLFDQQQRLQYEHCGTCNKLAATADVYFGIHQEEYYIQHSPTLRAALQDSFSLSAIQNQKKILPQIEFKPYIMSGSSRTPHINIGKQTPALISSSSDDLSTSVALKQDYLDYPFDAGFYIHSKANVNGVSIENETVCGANKEITLDFEDDIQEEDGLIIITSLWHWWKEVLAISIAMSLFINLFVTRFVWKRMKRKLLAQSTSNSDQQIQQASTSKSGSEKAAEGRDIPLSHSNSTTSSFSSNSRYSTEFEYIQQLGKGGFGIVVEVRNKVDNGLYAIKRILLPRREEARKKVMREVQALASLEHMNIVRYYTSWLEESLPGSQEHLDQLWEPSVTAASSMPSPTPSSKPITPSHKQSNKFFRNPFNFSESLNSGTGASNTGLKDEEENESGSFSYDRKDARCNSSSSMEIVFEEFHKEGDPISQIATSSHSARLTTTIGNDSGCAEHSRCTEDYFEKDLSETPFSKLNRPDNLKLKPSTSEAQTEEPPEKKYLYIQMQLCRKETLKDWLTKNMQRDRNQVINIFKQIVSAVHYVHERNLMHRDLKPSNIFFSTEGIIKVGDFGLVTALSENDAHTPAEPDPNRNTNNIPEKTHSRHTAQVGTELYMSPEQIARQPYSQKVDVYSLGLIFFELLVPFSTGMERVMVIQNLKNHIFPKDFRKKFTEECTFVQRLVSRDPVDRPSIQDVMDDPILDLPEEYSFNFRRQRTLSQRVSSSGSECEQFSGTPNEDSPIVNMVVASS